MAKRKAASREGHILTTVSLPQELHRRMAMAALEDGWATAEILRVALTEWLAARAKRRKGAR